jgi:hypothetical protein
MDKFNTFPFDQIKQTAKLIKCFTTYKKTRPALNKLHESGTGFISIKGLGQCEIPVLNKFNDYYLH